MSSAFRLKGELNAAALEQSINEIVKRHESLRTCFSLIGAEAVQVITSSLKVPLNTVDLSGQSEPERTALALARDEAHRPFDLLKRLVASYVGAVGQRDHCFC
jgi:hypothetical protein